MYPHHLLPHKCAQKFPIEFLSTIRRDTETTNQTMRMMGTYSSGVEAWGDHSNNSNHRYQSNFSYLSNVPIIIVITQTWSMLID